MVLFSHGRKAVRRSASNQRPWSSGLSRPPARPLRHRLPISLWETQSWTKKVVKGRVSGALNSNRWDMKRTDDLE